MTDIPNIIISFPTVIFTVLLGVVLLYWGMVILGAFDVDILDVGGADGAMDGAAEGAAEGVAEGAAEATTEGLAEGAVEAAADGAAEGATEGATEGAEASSGGLAGLLSALRLRSAPLTVVLSLLFIFSWVFCFVLMRLLSPLLVDIVPQWVLGSAVLVVAVAASIPLTSVTSRPFGRFFVVHQAPRRKSLYGKICVVTTGRVDEKFGQATCDDGGAGLLLQVRCDVMGRLKRGQKALIVDYDSDRDAFLVEPYDELLNDDQEKKK